MVKNRFEVYKCAICGNIVEVNFVGGGELVCCNQPMNLQKENTEDASLEKHVPVVEKVEGGILVKVGSTPHPMEEKHYIEWIEVIFGEENQKVFLKPNDKPEAFFCVEKTDDLIVRAYCNLHGLWKV